MKLPPKEDPHGNQEGSLPRSIVLQVLKEFDVQIDDLGSHLYLFSASDEVESQKLPEMVGGLMIRRLSKKFAIRIVDFYWDETGQRRYKPH